MFKVQAVYIKVMISCKTCKQEKPLSAYSKIKRKGKESHRLSCKVCEYQKSRARNHFAQAPESRLEINVPFEVEAAMPSDSELLFYSTDYYDILQLEKVAPYKETK